MKKIILVILLFITSSLFAQVDFITATIDSGATVSDTLTIPPGNEIVGLIMPADLTDSLYIYVGFKQDSILYQLCNEDSTVYVIRMDSTKATAITFIYDILLPYRYISFTSNDEATADKQIIVLYKEE